MAKRPPLNDRSFLAAIFSPSKNPVPVGLRKGKLTGVTGRSKARLAAYNRMSALNQEVLKRSGQREAYLRGDVKIADAKRALRDTAVDLGIAKPLRPRVTVPTRPSRAVSDRSRVLDHMYTVLTGTTTRKPVNITALRQGTQLMTKDQLRRAIRMTAPEVKEAGHNADEEIELENGTKRNPFWYH